MWNQQTTQLQSVAQTEQVSFVDQWLVRAVWAVAIIFIMLLCTLPAHASGLGIAPIRVEFTGQEKVAMVTLENSGAEKVTVQAQVVQWTQSADGVDSYAPTTDVMVFPPVFTLDPGQSQIVRLGLRNVQPGNTQLTYRVFFEEVPAAVQPGRVKVAVRHSVPIFVAPITTQVKMSAQIKTILNPAAASAAKAATPATITQVLVSNQGNVHVQVRGIAFAMQDPFANSSAPGSAPASAVPGAKAMEYESVFGYALAGKTRGYPIKKLPPAGAKFIVLDTDQGERALPLQ